MIAAPRCATRLAMLPSRPSAWPAHCAASLCSSCRLSGDKPSFWRTGSIVGCTRPTACTKYCGALAISASTWPNNGGTTAVAPPTAMRAAKIVTVAVAQVRDKPARCSRATTGSKK